MPQFQALHVWGTTEILTASDLVGEFSWHRTHMTADGNDGASATLANMQAQTDPYPSSTPAQGSSTGDELRQLRAILARIAGTTYWYQAGAVVGKTPVRMLLQGNAGVGIKLAQVLIDASLTITKVVVWVDTAPAGADLIIDLNKNGTSIWSTQGNRAKIVAGAQSGSQTVFDTTTVVQGDRLSLDVDQVGSSTPGGNDLLVTVVFG
jgi:hypothetical protein